MQLILFILFLAIAQLQAQDIPPTDNIVETHSSVQIDGKSLSYRADTGYLILKNEEGKPQAKMFFVAYFKTGDESDHRPITYCFNGGPGSSSIWLHIGAFGPKRVQIAENGTLAPYQFENNPESLLDVTDLVFIDPVSSGYSRALLGESPKQFHGVEEDIKSVAEFIRLFTTRYGLWNSPKFLAGESYGSMRAVGLASYLHNDMGVDVNGVVLISSILNFQTIYNPKESLHDFPYIFLLPTMTATAWYHQKLPADLQAKSLKDVLQDSENFAINEYSRTLLQGNLLSQDARKQLVTQLSRFTGLNEAYIMQSNCRISPYKFCKELLRNDYQLIGRFDSRFIGYSVNPCGEWGEYDPSFERVMGAYNATFNNYVSEQLNWKLDDRYQLIADVLPWWNYGKGPASLDMTSELRDAMIKNPQLKIFVASGFYDFATPYFATVYTFRHLFLEPLLEKNIQMKFYEAGHCIYQFQPEFSFLKRDLAQFYKSTKSH